MKPPRPRPPRGARTRARRLVYRVLGLALAAVLSTACGAGIADSPPGTGEWRSVRTTGPDVDRPEALEAIISELHEDWPHAGYVASVHDGRVVAFLWPGEEEAAREMSERFGDKVELWLGRQRYPDGFIQDECLSWLTQTADPFLNVQAPALEVEVGGRFTGTATLTNTGSEPQPVKFLGLEAVVVEPGTTEPLAVTTGPGGPGTEVEVVEPGASLPGEFVGGTASCQPEIGYTLPPGNYEYRLLVTRPRAPEVDDMEMVGYWSEPFPLTVR